MKKEIGRLTTTRENGVKKQLTYASLFAGIGGFESGINKLGGVNVFASEIDKFARQSYEVLYGVEPSGDITKIDSKDIPDHDLLTAGFPCQAFSVAGKRAGMAYICEECEHEQTISFNQYADRAFDCEECNGSIKAVDGRGLLFFEVARVARDKQPKVVLLENVKGLVGHDKGRTLDTIVHTLSEIGYVVDFEVLNSKFFGVPQNRERIFIIAVREDIQQAEKWTEESLKGQTVIPKGKRRIAECDDVKTFNFEFPSGNQVTKHLYDIMELGVDEWYYLDDGKPSVFSEGSDGIQPKKPNERFSRQAISVLNNHSGTISHGDTIQAFNRQYDSSGLCPTLTTRPEGFKTASLVVESLPMDCEGKHNYKEFVAEPLCRHTRIRKLTPKECWRLQGFTDEQHDAVEAAGVSNSQRYKQAGNAVTVTVIEALVERIIKLLEEEK